MGRRFCCFGAPRSREKKNGYRTKSDSDPLLYFIVIQISLTSKNVQVLGQGTLRDETQVAIKSLSAESKQGTNEFLTEIDMVSNIRHPNLVQLMGCCVEGRNRILVYEYLENNSLENALLGPKNKRIALDWPKRAAICVGTAHGLAFLHEEAEPHIVHRDIKASNVLLDRDLAPKIGDFGLAKLFPDNVTHISTRVAGTMGYLAPEYALLGQLTKKADIYSFGVLVLEIISGRSGSKSVWELDMHTLLEWAKVVKEEEKGIRLCGRDLRRPLNEALPSIRRAECIDCICTFQTWKLRDEDRLLDMVDPGLVGYPEEEVLRFVKVALFCTQGTSNQRPSMKQVVEMLSDEVSLDVGSLIQPGVVKDRDRTPGNPSGSSMGVWRQKGDQLANASSPITSTRNMNSSTMSIIEVEPR
ncbi:cold-responsive protein kinase 1 [Cocos nucifera]|uniref:Cold-responsive protein kinase 1 n=1 Tax=Cocos nucifera TaxID=13894 RepID=A0A8K0I598_COCNU|nr:cold-responsive protein kinase 1 [Cocos nucifera]